MNASELRSHLPPTLAYSFRAFRVAGIDVRISLIVLALFGLLFVYRLSSSDTPTLRTFTPLLLVLALFLCMALHEAGHAAAAKTRGIQPVAIILSFVGVTIFEAGKAKPGDEWRIALAGPMTNLLLALIFIPWIWDELALLASNWQLPPLETSYDFALWLCLANLLIAALNMLPLYPLDGSKVVKGLLSRVFPHHTVFRNILVLSMLTGTVGLGYVVAGMIGGGEIGFVDIAIVALSWVTLSSSARALPRLNQA